MRLPCLLSHSHRIQRVSKSRTPLSSRCLSSQVSSLRLQDEAPDTLTHIHLSSSSDKGFPTYASAAELQTQLRTLFLAHKSAVSSDPSTGARPPPPVVLSFTPTPTYTLGRRQGALSPEQDARLRKPLRVLGSDFPPNAAELERNGGSLDAGPPQFFEPTVVETDRGGLTTYHGPGQIVLWPILDLHSPHHAQLTVRSYARLLEQTTQAVLQQLGIPTYLSEADPGVWVGRQRSPQDQTREQERKIAALGVHLRRHITGLGLALNIDIPVQGDEAVNPWARFVPCGLEGKAVTSVRNELGRGTWNHVVSRRQTQASAGYRAEVASHWVQELGRRLGTRSVTSKCLDISSGQSQASPDSQ